MRLIKENKQERIHKCGFCKSILAYKHTDILSDFWDNKYMKCPVCKERIYPSIFNRKVK